MAKIPKYKSRADATPKDAGAIEEFVEARKGFLPKRDLFIITVAAVGLVVVLYLMFFAPSIEWLQTSKQIGTVEVKGNARRRHSGSLAWQNVAGKQKLYLRDVIYVPPDAGVRVTLGEKSFDLPPDTMVQFDENALGKAYEITVLDFPKNLAPPKLPVPLKVTKLTNFLPETTPLELRLSELKERALNRVFSALPIVEPNRLNLREINFDDFELYGIKLVSPTSDRYNLKTNRWMRLSWTPLPVKEIQYKLEISKEPTFRRVLPHTTKTNKLQVQFDEEATFFWRVRANYKEREIISEPGQFSMVLRGGKHQMTTTLPVQIPNEIPTGYPVEIARDKKFKDIVRSLVNAEPKCPMLELAKGTYYCRIRDIKGPKILKVYQYVVE